MFKTPILDFYVFSVIVLDQLANLHFHFTSVPRCTPMGVEVQRNTDGDTPSMIVYLVCTIS